MHVSFCLFFLYLFLSRNERRSQDYAWRGPTSQGGAYPSAVGLKGSALKLSVTFPHSSLPGKELAELVGQLPRVNACAVGSETHKTWQREKRPNLKTVGTVVRNRGICFCQRYIRGLVSFAQIRTHTDTHNAWHTHISALPPTYTHLYKYYSIA